MIVTVNIKRCTYCESLNVKKNGKASNGKQQFVCKDCKRSFRENPSPNGYTPEAKEQILRAYQERSSLRGLTRTFGVSRNTVTSWIKKNGMWLATPREVSWVDERVDARGKNG